MREAGAGGEGIARGTRVVDFMQGTWVDGEFATVKKGSPLQVSYFFYQTANMHPPNLCVFRIKRVLCAG